MFHLLYGMAPSHWRSRDGHFLVLLHQPLKIPGHRQLLRIDARTHFLRVCLDGLAHIPLSRTAAASRQSSLMGPTALEVAFTRARKYQPCVRPVRGSKIL